jgi:hypothetical protein
MFHFYPCAHIVALVLTRFNTRSLIHSLIYTSCEVSNLLSL